MKYETTPSFRGDYKRLNKTERRAFRSAVESINEAYAEHRAHGGKGRPQWPKDLRIKPVTDARGGAVFEMTWSFAGPDGRATFEYFAVDDEEGIRWRRIGDHRVVTARNA